MAKKQTFLKSMLESMGKPVDRVTPEPGQRLRLSRKRLGIPLPAQPVEVELGKERLHIQKEIRCDGSSASNPPDLVVYNPDLDSEQINYSLRIKPGQSLHISQDQPYQEHLFRKPRKAFRRNFRLDHAGENLIFRDSNSEYKTFITLLEQNTEQSPIVTQRNKAIDKIIALFGGPLEAMPPDQALTTIQQVNALLLNDAFRAQDASGAAGGLVELPAHITPVVIGDLHANIDNLLKILSENAFMQVLEKGTGVLVFLGDLVHPDEEPFDSMDSSVLTMDFLFKLKLRFPQGVFFLRGNHDSFSTDVAKDLVPQAVLWRKKLEQIRGTEYCEQIAQFYDLSPVVALSGDFVACHAGPPQNKTDLIKLKNIRTFPGLMHDLMWNRVRRPGYPAGYTRSDVRRFRKSLNLDKELPFLVGHTPYSDTGTLWCDVAGIQHHHILYSAKADQMAIFTRVNGKMVPQVYSAEPLLEWTNNRAIRVDGLSVTTTPLFC
jgi:hypothetical protein